MSDYSIEIQEGHPYPGWQSPFEASILKVTADGLHLLTSIPFPRPVDMDDFRNLADYGVYIGEFPLVIWKFGDNFLLPTPCNPVFERQENPGETEEFFSRLPVRFSRALIDVHGIVRVLGETDLKKDFVQNLARLWTDPKNEWISYNNWLMYIFQTGTHLLWKKARKFVSEPEKQMKKPSRDTLVVHGLNSNHTTSMDLVPPIHMTAVFKFKDADFGAGLFDGSREGFVYSRLSNPTVRLFQEKMALLEGGEDAVATASGMSAISAVALTLAKCGDNFLASSTVYGGTFALFKKHLFDLNIEARLISPAKARSASEIESKIDGRTRFLFIETPANPTLDIFDIELWVSVAKQHGIPLVVDNTFASPYLQNPLLLGADMVVHSATKYIGGHGDVVGGIAIGTRERMQAIRETYTNHFGPAMSPFNAWLFLRGLKTLALRMNRHSDSALKIAGWLESHPKVEKMHYPGRASHPGHSIAARQMRKFGGMIAFEVAGGIQAGKKLMDSLKLCTLAVSLGDCETLIQHPASMTHSTYSKEERLNAGIADGLIRMSVGLEDADDLIADLEQGLTSV